MKFVNSPRSEEVRWKSTGVEVFNGWFASHGFLVVDALRDDIPRQIQVVYPRKDEYREVDVTPFEVAWAKVESEFWAELDHYLPEARKLHDRVTVDIGRYGTVSSSYWSSAHYYLRNDRKVGDLAAMIINHTLYEIRKSVGVTWTKREALMDFIMTRPAMKQLFPEFEPVFTQLARVSAFARKESEKYLRELGVPEPKKEFEVEKMHLSKLEKKVLRVLLDHKGELVEYDALADSVWGVGEFKTFWAINKLVERMRVKLNKLGIDGKRVESVRGQGYLLK